MTRFATIAALSAALATPALAHDDRCGTQPPPIPANAQPADAAEGLAWSIDMLQWTVDWSLDLAEAFGAPEIDRAEIDVAMAALDDLVALVASMEAWDQGWEQPAAQPDATPEATPKATPKAGKNGKKRKGTVRARRS